MRKFNVRPYGGDWLQATAHYVFVMIEVVGFLGFCTAFYFGYCLANPPSLP